MTGTDAIYIEKLTPNLALEMLPIQGGRFEMGSESEESYDDESPIHSVELSSFFMGKYPVTQAQWQAVMGNNPSYFKGAHRPVEQVSWDEVQDFLSKLNDRASQRYRLPTEAEWEYAARGGQLSQGYLYAGSNEIEEVGWYWGNKHRETKEVGQKFPNELGLYDMSGNVWEWCEDYYSDSHYASCASRGVVVNPVCPKQEATEGANRVLRGGGWDGNARICRSSHRDDGDPAYRDDNIGFRLVFSL